MTRELHIFAIISVLMYISPLGPDRVVCTYLHVLLPFLRLVPCANECYTVHGWSGRLAS